MSQGRRSSQEWPLGPSLLFLLILWAIAALDVHDQLANDCTLKKLSFVNFKLTDEFVYLL